MRRSHGRWWFLARPCARLRFVPCSPTLRTSHCRRSRFPRTRLPQPPGILRLWMRGDIGFECFFMRVLCFDEQIISIGIMLRADVRPPPVGSSDIDHCTDFEVAVRHAPERAVGGHGAKRGDFRRLHKQFFRRRISCCGGWQSTYGIRVLNRQDTIAIRKLHPVTRMRTVCVNIEHHLPSSLAEKCM